MTEEQSTRSEAQQEGEGREEQAPQPAATVDESESVPQNQGKTVGTMLGMQAGPLSVAGDGDGTGSSSNDNGTDNTEPTTTVAQVPTPTETEIPAAPPNDILPIVEEDDTMIVEKPKDRGDKKTAPETEQQEIDTTKEVQVDGSNNAQDTKMEPAQVNTTVVATDAILGTIADTHSIEPQTLNSASARTLNLAASTGGAQINQPSSFTTGLSEGVGGESTQGGTTSANGNSNQYAPVDNTLGISFNNPSGGPTAGASSGAKTLKAVGSAGSSLIIGGIVAACVVLVVVGALVFRKHRRHESALKKRANDNDSEKGYSDSRNSFASSFSSHEAGIPPFKRLSSFNLEEGSFFQNNENAPDVPSVQAAFAGANQYGPTVPQNSAQRETFSDDSITNSIFKSLQGPNMSLDGHHQSMSSTQFVSMYQRHMSVVSDFSHISESTVGNPRMSVRNSMMGPLVREMITREGTAVSQSPNLNDARDNLVDSHVPYLIDYQLSNKLNTNVSPPTSVTEERAHDEAISEISSTRESVYSESSNGSVFDTEKVVSNNTKMHEGEVQEAKLSSMKFDLLTGIKEDNGTRWSVISDCQYSTVEDDSRLSMVSNSMSEYADPF